MRYASYRASITINRPDNTTSHDGDLYISYWGGAVVGDLRADLLDPNLPDRLNRFARKAHRWFEDAWYRAGINETRFPIARFAIQLFNEPGQQGQMVAEIDVLSGTWERTA
jgi:hypothetical protein